MPFAGNSDGAQQFNVLRILRGQKGKPANLSTLNERMVSKMSNTTRLVDKLMNKGYDRKQLTRFLNTCLKADMKFDQLNVILNFPTSSFKEGLDTFDFLKKYKKIIRAVSKQKFRIYENTDLERNPQKYHIKINKAKNKDLTVASTFTFKDLKGMSIEEADNLNYLYNQSNEKQINRFIYAGILNKLKSDKYWNKLRKNMSLRLLKERFVILDFDSKEKEVNFIDLSNGKYCTADALLLNFLNNMPFNKKYDVKTLVKNICKKGHLE